MAATLEDVRRTVSGGYRRSCLKLVALGLMVLVCSWHTGLLDLQRMVEGGPALCQLRGEMFPPDFSNMRKWGKPVVDTLCMSVAGTFIALVLSLPVGLLAAGNVAPNRAVYRLARGILNILRSVPELIMGIVFVAAVGFGALPGALALGLHSVGMVGKFFAEAIEHCDPKPVEAIRAVGATRAQTVLYGILPQVMPQLVDTLVYRWEYNFRASTVMGMVGAGGIGFELMASLRIMQYREVSAILLVILVMVTLVDGLGSRIRRKVS